MKRRRLQPLPPAPTPSACLHSDDRRRAQTRARRLLSVRERRASLRSRAALHVPSNKSVGQKREKKTNKIKDAQSLRPLCVSASAIGPLPAPSASLPHRALTPFKALGPLCSPTPPAVR